MLSGSEMDSSETLFVTTLTWPAVWVDAREFRDCGFLGIFLEGLIERCTRIWTRCVSYKGDELMHTEVHSKQAAAASAR